MIDIVFRYYTIARAINKLPYKKILEVGSDDYGIAPFMNSSKKITFFDTGFRRKKSAKSNLQDG